MKTPLYSSLKKYCFYQHKFAAAAAIFLAALAWYVVLCTTATAATQQKPLLQLQDKGGQYDVVLTEDTPLITTLQIVISGAVTENFTIALPTGDWSVVGGAAAITPTKTSFAIGNMEAGGLVYPKGVIATVKSSAPLAINYTDKPHTFMQIATTSGYESLVMGIETTSPDINLLEGETASVQYKILPPDATNTNITWSSSSSDIAAVSSSGLVTALKSGTAIITAATENGGHTAVTAVSVSKKNIPVTGLVISPKTLSMEAGKTGQLSASISPTGATDKSMTWISGNKSVATVNSSGLVTAIAAGTAVITGTTNDGSHTDSSTITVTAVPVTPSDPTQSQDLRPVAPDLPAGFPEGITPSKPNVTFIPDANDEEKAEAIKSLIENMVYVNEGDLTIDKRGYVVPTLAFLKEAADNGGIKNDGQFTPLPVFTASVEKGGTVAVGFAMQGGYLLSDKAETAHIMAVRAVRTGVLFDYASAPSEFGDKKYTIFDSWGRLVKGIVKKYDDYTLTLFIKDGGPYDLDGKANGTVSCIFSAVGYETSDSEEDASVVPQSGSSGGCNSGAVASMAFIPLLTAWWYKKNGKH